MTTMEVLCICAMQLLSFVIGAKIGQKTSKGEDIKMPSLNPMDIYQEHREKEQAKKEKDKLEAVLKNMDRYDGTDAGQEDIE